MPHVLPQRSLVGLALLALAGCTSVKALEGPPRDLRVLYETSLSGPQPRLRMQSPTASPEDPLPTLLQPPRVQKVWVPAQRTPEGDLVAGHWTYLLLEAPQWRLEQAPTAGLPRTPLPLPSPAPALPPVLGQAPASGDLPGGAEHKRFPTESVAPGWPPVQGEAP
ncbi:MAG: hypothetical protein AB7N91_22640 [Candidatus Tectimicrobiota bacterium]